MLNPNNNLIQNNNPGFNNQPLINDFNDFENVDNLMDDEQLLVDREIINA
jgi:hypothetical protein